MPAAMSGFSVESLESSSSGTDSHRGGVMLPTDRFTETAKDLEAIIANLKNGHIEDTEEKLQSLVGRLNRTRDEAVVEWLHRTRDEAVVEEAPVIGNMGQIIEETAKTFADTSTLSSRIDDPVTPTLSKIVALLKNMEQQRSDDQNFIAKRLSEMEMQRVNDNKQFHQQLTEIVKHVATLHEKVNDSSVTTNERFDLITTDIANIEQALEGNAESGHLTIEKKIEEKAVETNERHAKIDPSIEALIDRAESASSQLSTIQEHFAHEKINESMAVVSAQLETFGLIITTKLADVEKKVDSITTRITSVDQHQISSSSDMTSMERRLYAQKTDFDAIKKELSSIQSAIHCTSDDMCTSSAISAMEQRIYNRQDAQTRAITTEMAVTVNKAAVSTSADITKILQTLHGRSSTIEKKIGILVQELGKTFGNSIITRDNTVAVLRQLEKVSSHTREIPGLSTIQTKNYMSMMYTISKKNEEFGVDIENVSKRVLSTGTFLTDCMARLTETLTLIPKISGDISDSTSSVKDMQGILQGLTENLSRFLGNSDDIKRDVQAVPQRQTSLKKSLLATREAEPGTDDGMLETGSHSCPRIATIRLSPRDKAQLNTTPNVLVMMKTDLSSHLEMDGHANTSADTFTTIPSDPIVGPDCEINNTARVCVLQLFHILGYIFLAVLNFLWYLASRAVWIWVLWYILIVVYWFMLC